MIYFFDGEGTAPAGDDEPTAAPEGEGETATPAEPAAPAEETPAA